jgi:hypothetical protein
LFADCFTENGRPAIVSVVARGSAGFGATLKVTVPLPEPLLSPITTQSTVDAAVHVHAPPLTIVTVTVPPPPAALNCCSVGAIVNVQTCGAAWLTVKVWPAIVIVPDRAGPLFAATENATLPLPEPPGADVTLIHGAFDTAVHVQPSPAVTVTVPLPPASATDWLAGAIANVHWGAGADCVTVNVWPPTAIVPLRAAPMFTATVKLMVPLPVPDPPLTIVIHGVVVVAVHEQLGSVAVTAMVPGPP